MTEKAKIKVIKRSEPRPTKRKARVKSTRQTARDLASTVTDWVTDLKERKSEETRAALDLLFTGNHPVRDS
ncbi:MAG: hypothetical protein KBD94_11360 [Pyrinomonadaceae bacterium]|nr:hypothetical protein [Pyrinomonadaceae bacterium]